MKCKLLFLILLASFLFLATALGKGIGKVFLVGIAGKINYTCQ